MQCQSCHGKKCRGSSIRTVSYTHLDVYKRQGLPFSSKVLSTIPAPQKYPLSAVITRISKIFFQMCIRDSPLPLYHSLQPWCYNVGFSLSTQNLQCEIKKQVPKNLQKTPPSKPDGKIIIVKNSAPLNLTDVMIHNPHKILRLLEIQFQGQAAMILPELVT